MGQHKHSNFVSSVSPDGKELSSLDILNNKLQTWQISRDGLHSKDHDWQQIGHLSLTKNFASIAISNRGKDDDIYIAVSRICDKDIQIEEKKFDDDLLQDVSVDSVDSGSDGTLFTPTTSFTPDSPSIDTYYEPSTYASSATVDFSQEQAIIIIHINKAGQTNPILTSSISKLKGGIVKFIDSNKLMILRGKEFTRVIFDNENILSESFPYPESMISELKMRSLKSSKSLLNGTVIKNYFFLSKSTQQNIIYEMYGLDDLELKHVFHVKKIVDNSSCEYTNSEGRTPLFAMSENGKLLAASLCKKFVTIFLIENSLMVASYNFCKKSNKSNGDNSCNDSAKIKILNMKFFDNDNKLVVLTQERNEVYTTIWDLFNCNTQNPYIAHLDSSIIPLLDEPIDHGMRKCEQICGRPLEIFSNYLVYPAQLMKGSSGVNLVSFKEKHRESKYEDIINGNEKDFYNDFVQNPNQKIRYKIFDCNGKKLLNSDDLIIEDSEPWDNTPNKFQIVVWLDIKKTIQLIIGNESIQVWDQNRKLVYIWTPLLSREYYPDPTTSDRISRSVIRPRVPPSPQGSINLMALTTPAQPSNCKIHHFTLKKFTSHQYQYKMTFSFGIKQFYKYLPREKDYIKSACNALEFLGWQMKHTEYLDNKLRRYLNKTIQETRLLIKKFISEQPQTWKLLDIRECIMSHLVAARCDDLISYIVDENRDLMLHNPRRYAWSEREVMECNRLITNVEENPGIQTPKRGFSQIFGKREIKSSDKNHCLRKPSDLKIAIDRTNKNAIKGLVNYYSTLSMNNIGWMFTVSDELLGLQRYNSDYVEELFYQPNFGAMEALHLNKAKLISEIPPPGSKNSIRALYDVPTKLTESPNTTNNKLDAPWVMTCIVPLPDFTVSKNGFQQSTFTQMVSISSSSNESMDFIFDNPAVEAIVDFKWFKYAKKRIYFLLILYVFYQICFGFLCYVYIKHLPSANLLWNLTIPSACWILLFGGFLVFSEVNQVLFLKTKYIRIYNIFDLLSSILPLICTIFLLKVAFDEWMKGHSGFQMVKTNEHLLILLSMTILTLWIQLLMKMRSLPIIGEYVFIIINLSKRIAPFLIAMIVIILGLAHAMFILLSQTEGIGLKPNLSKYTFTNPTTQETYILEESVDVNDKYDNMYSDIFTSIKAVYFWINGQWDQLGLWNFWPVVALSMFGSLFLVIIMQNILIALMSDVVDEAKEIGKRAFLKLRAELISEVEISYLTKKQLQDKSLFPSYIYYIINCDEARHWVQKCKKRNSAGHFNNGEKKVALQEKDHKKTKRESFKEKDVFKMEKIHEGDSNIVPNYQTSTDKKEDNKNKNIGNTTNIGYDENNRMVENNSDSLESRDSRLEGKIADLERNIKLLLELAKNNNR